MKTAARFVAIACAGCFLTGSPLRGEEVTHQLLMPGTVYQTDLWIKRSADREPVVMVIGGVHGNEPAGYLAANRLREWEVSKGTLALIPEAHKEAIRRQVRGYPGNMNAMFPGDPLGNDMQRLAHAIWSSIKATHPGLLITLHESVGYHALEPERYGQTLTYDFEILRPLMDRAIGRVNPDIAPGHDRFESYIKAFPTCPTYNAWKWLHIPATSLETAKGMALDQRVRYQLMMLMGLFDEVGLRYEQSDLPRLSTAHQEPGTDLRQFASDLSAQRPETHRPAGPEEQPREGTRNGGAASPGEQPAAPRSGSAARYHPGNAVATDAAPGRTQSWVAAGAALLSLASLGLSLLLLRRRSR